jgi:hypothetical protein
VAKRAQRRARRQPPGPPKKRGIPRQGLAIAAVFAVILLAGLWFKFGGGGAKELPIPAPRTADGKVVVLEFSDYG